MKRRTDEADQAAPALGAREILPLADREAERQEGVVQFLRGQRNILAVTSVCCHREASRQRLREALHHRQSLGRKWHTGRKFPQASARVKKRVGRHFRKSEGKAKTFYSIKQAQGTNCYLKKRIHCGRRGSGTDGKMN